MHKEGEKAYEYATTDEIIINNSVNLLSFVN